MKILRILGVVAVVVLIICVGISAVLSYKVRNLKNVEPPLVDKGEFKAPAIGDHEFKYQVCHHFFPLKLYSDVPSQVSAIPDSACTIRYKNKEIVFLNGSRVYSSNVEFYQTGFMKFTYGKRPAKELMQLTYESNRAPESYIYFTQKHLEDALIYTLGSMGRASSRAQTFEKYTSGEKLIYVWITPEGDSKIDVLSEDFLVTCMGNTCLEYLSLIKLI